VTFQELKSKLEAEGFNEQFYCIGDGWNRLSNAHALVAAPGGFEFFYTERGQKSVIEFFANENDACVFAYDFFAKDKWAKSHLVGFFDSKNQADALISKLQKTRIEYTTDAIPYDGWGNYRYRVFVYGTDFQKIKELGIE
jgi:hypothetical protein